LKRGNAVSGVSSKKDTIMTVVKTEKEWEKELTPEEYYVLREKGTEVPYSGKFNMHFEKGIYTCKACGAVLFDSSSKFDSHCGWPSFDKEIEKNRIIEKPDTSHGMVRTEILCA
jgi:peptide-methionine (R)-S-oxide reductase